MWRAVLIDDEPEARRVLRDTIEAVCPQLRIVGEAGSLSEALRVVQTLQPDLVFLDMELGDGHGLDLLSAFPKPDFKVVVVSGHRDFALDAFRHRAWHYLLKPVRPQDLAALCNELRDAAAPVYLPDPQRLRFSAAQGVVFLHPEDICGAIADASHASLLLASGEKLFVSHTLSQLEAMLPEGQFLRVHQSYLVRIAAVVRLNKTEPTSVVLRNKLEVPVSRRNREMTLRALGL